MNASAHPPVAVIGAGSWGTALAVLIRRNDHLVRLWGYEPEHIAGVARQRRNERFLPGIELAEGIEPTSGLAAALEGAHYVVVAVPSHAFREVLGRMRAALNPESVLIGATKGLERNGARLTHEIVGEVLGEHRLYAVVSGPTFALEVARGLPTAATVACTDERVAEGVASMLQGESFRAYTSTDVVGVQLGGSIKNVLAIAAGISDGLGFGANARAALITRGLAEIMRLGCAMGGQAETFMGLAGAGDLILTCTDDQSRNRRFGLALARGQSAAEAEALIGQVVEGFQTTEVVYGLAREHGVDMPITEQVYHVLYKGRQPHDAVGELFARAQKPEFDASLLGG